MTDAPSDTTRSRSVRQSARDHLMQLRRERLRGRARAAAQGPDATPGSGSARAVSLRDDQDLPMTIGDGSPARHRHMNEEMPDDDLGMVAFGHARDRRDAAAATEDDEDAPDNHADVELSVPEADRGHLPPDPATQALTQEGTSVVTEGGPMRTDGPLRDMEPSWLEQDSRDPFRAVEADAVAPARLTAQGSDGSDAAPNAETRIANTAPTDAPIADTRDTLATDLATDDPPSHRPARDTTDIPGDAWPPGEASAPASDLATLPGAGPGLVWMLQRAGVPDRAALVDADADSLTRSLGLVGEVLDIAYWIEQARAEPPPETDAAADPGA